MEETPKRVTLIGYPMSGKTRLLKRVERKFIPGKHTYQPTVHSREISSTVQWPNAQGPRLDIHEIPGFENSQLRTNFQIPVDSAIWVMLDRSKKLTLDYVEWLKKSSDEKKCPIIFIYDELQAGKKLKITDADLMELSKGFLHADFMCISEDTDVDTLCTKTLELCQRPPMRVRPSNNVKFFNFKEGNPKEKVQQEMLEALVWDKPCDESGELSNKQLLILDAFLYGVSENFSTDRAVPSCFQVVENELQRVLQKDSVQPTPENKCRDRVLDSLHREFQRKLDGEDGLSEEDKSKIRVLMKWLYHGDNYKNLNHPDALRFPFVKKYRDELAAIPDRYQKMGLINLIFHHIRDVDQIAQVRDTMTLAERIYDFILDSSLFESGAVLLKGLDLPAKIVDILQDCELNLPERAFVVDKREAQDDLEQVTTNVHDATTPLISQFFQYAYAPALKHSRQLRATEINESLAPDDNGKYEPKQLIMLFVHYMSIRHVNSTLSRELEDSLAKVLMRDDEYQTYKNTCNDDRAGIFKGKKRDRVANALREKLEEKFRPLKKIDLLIQILDCVDDLETGFFSYKSETGKAQIEGAMELADRVYEHLTKKTVFTTVEVDDLIRSLTLPSDAIKIMRNTIPDPSINPLM